MYSLVPLFNYDTYRASCKIISVHGSIPHHERKYSTLRRQEFVRPEVSKPV